MEKNYIIIFENSRTSNSLATFVYLGKYARETFYKKKKPNARD